MFLVLALSSESGTDALPAVLFALIAWSDYFDGIAARVTGQYSRMGALLDPLVDRLLIIAGVIVCWKFELLPRWALAVLAARELFMLVLARYAMAQARGSEDQLVRPLGRVARVQRAVLRPLRRRDCSRWCCCTSGWHWCSRPLCSTFVTVYGKRGHKPLVELDERYACRSVSSHVRRGLAF